MDIPTIWSPSGPYLFCKSMNHGISTLQGGHHVAQKLRTTALPRKSAKRMVLPVKSFSAKSGACRAACPADGVEAGFSAEAYNINPRTSMRDVPTIRFRFIWNSFSSQTGQQGPSGKAQLWLAWN